MHFPVWWGAWLALQYKKTLVMSPRGSFNPLQLQHSAWKKRLVGWMDRWLLRRASVIHATCEGEREWVRKFLEPQNPQKYTKKIVVIPNGVGEVLTF
jgi:Glycosyltransferase Family 4